MSVGMDFMFGIIVWEGKWEGERVEYTVMDFIFLHYCESGMIW